MLTRVVGWSKLTYFLIYFPPLNSFRTFMYCDLWISKFKKEKFPRLLYEKIRYVLMKHTNLCNSSQTSIYGKIILFLGTVFPHIVAAATILF